MVQNDIDDERQTNRTPNNTRRQFVAGTAGALGGLAAGTGFVAPALAQDDEDEEAEQPDEEDEEEEEPIENEFEDDVDILNYARTLELLEATFYEQGLENLDEEDFCNCGVLSEDSALAERVYQELQTIQEHEQAHVETLGQVIEMMDGELAEEPEFDFGVRVEYVDVFLATAVQLEDVGVSAYAGAAPFIEDENLVPPALGIHSVEARHASFLRTLTNQTGFPNEIDEARSRSEVEELISDFIVDSTDEEMDEDDETDDETDDEADDEADDGLDDGTEDDDAGNETDDGFDPDEDGAGNETDEDLDTDDNGNVTSPDDDGNVTSPDDDGNVTSPDDDPGTGNETGNETDGTGNETDEEASSLGLFNL